MLLDHLLSSTGLDRERAYLTTLNKCRPPGSPPRSPKPSEVSACRPYLVAQLAAVDPKGVVAKIGRASCRERAQIPAVSVAFKKTQKLRQFVLTLLPYPSRSTPLL